jgi:hypothetical protein
MKKLIVLFITLIAVFISFAASAQGTSDSKFPLFSTAAAAEHHCPFDFVVWLDTKTDTYSSQPDKNKTGGAYICQRDADQMDYHFKQNSEDDRSKQNGK